MSLNDVLGELVIAGIGVLIASQAWVLQQVHKVNVLLSGKHTEYDLMIREIVRDIERLDERVERVERAEP